MYYHEIETELRLHTRIWYSRSSIETSNHKNCNNSCSVYVHCNGTFHAKLKLRWATPISTPVVMKFSEHHLSSKGNFSDVPRVYIYIYWNFVFFAPLFFGPMNYGVMCLNNSYFGCQCRSFRSSGCPNTQNTPGCAGSDIY